MLAFAVASFAAALGLKLYLKLQNKGVRRRAAETGAEYSPYLT